MSSATFRALRHHNYRLWAGADIVSVTGTWMQVLGVNWLILTITGSATSVGLSLVMQALPTLLLGMWGGALADRLPSRPLVIAAQVAQAGLAGVLAMIALTGVESVLPIYGVALAGGVVTALGGPALGRFGAEVVPPADLPNAMALGSILSSAGRILGMSLAGALLPFTGNGGLFVINAASFFVVIAAVVAMRREEFHRLAAAERRPGAVLAGLRYVLRTPWLLVVLALWFTPTTASRSTRRPRSCWTRSYARSRARRSSVRRWSSSSRPSATTSRRRRAPSCPPWRSRRARRGSRSSARRSSSAGPRSSRRSAHPAAPTTDPARPSCTSGRNGPTSPGGRTWARKSWPTPSDTPSERISGRWVGRGRL
ncbi:MFS transporter [Nonomuraea sp. K274]|uniref:MFS transporter n=1 Tax=Nonomuraea cypriaca TaxID=1187855 RepID=A0A931A6U2_9ACTN|nr:MFS transporter [Nonomuraea cypriaca]